METTEIRKQLKKDLGYNARQVLIKKEHYTTLVFTVRDASVDIDKVEGFANQFQKVDRCPVTHEILSGGNTFTEVKVSEEVKSKLSEKYLEDVMIAMAVIKAGETSHKINDKACLLKSRHSEACDLVVYDEDGSTGMIKGHNYHLCEDSARHISFKLHRLIK